MSQYNSVAEAREQAADYLGFAASVRIVTDGGVFEIPNPSLLDDDQQRRYDQLKLESEGWDKDEDGNLLEPYRKNGELVEHYHIQLARAILGDRYEAFVAAGGRGNDVNVAWWKMQTELARRRREDSKSAGSLGTVAPTPAGDGSGA
ncbi:hypothetical protein ABW16_01740 [Mycolicibacter heraklionensis]|uniref:Tail assembly chaperone n=1 Tax=Mycolicibacter heraklionensis TaxID=512402 RepID=A0ABR5FKP0_9MYCO|nr:hypothetical protein [Mycolicibacter heraklionensis]KLO31582.1 hypothetical protein ABW16_01740 [Mycolicibacter heraklionensis]